MTWELSPDNSMYTLATFMSKKCGTREASRWAAHFLKGF